MSNPNEWKRRTAKPDNSERPAPTPVSNTSELREAIKPYCWGNALSVDKNVDQIVQLITAHEAASVQAALDSARTNQPFKCEQGHEIYGHKTAEGWCCACEADIAVLNSMLQPKQGSKS